ncbi:serine protein kinase RIO [Candidatus Woesearchaeota archaeon]|nr:serine protein kinase RIO [Candidatus Woesearchaeota archaeon]
MARKTKEKWKTYGNVFDEFTLRNLFQLSSRGFFEELQSPIKIGKEANIFTAVTKDSTTVIVKIYRLETCDFNRMLDYIKTDQRYVNIRRSRRKIIFAWTQREFRNIIKAREAGVKVPTPYIFKDNILVMEQIGSPKPAPQLKEAYPEEPEAFYQTTIDYMRMMYLHGLIHGDLSQFNILNDNDNPVFIDFSQGLTTESHGWQDYLRRDIKNVANFFKKLGIDSDQDDLYTQITHK